MALDIASCGPQDPDRRRLEADQSKPVGRGGDGEEAGQVHNVSILSIRHPWAINGERRGRDMSRTSIDRVTEEGFQRSCRLDGSSAAWHVT